MRALSHLFSNMLGSVGGITYMNNPFHQIVARQRTVPVQPNTNNQVFAKTAFSDAVLAWENASDIQRQGWVDFAATVTFTGPLGDYHPSGRMLAIAQYQITGYLISRGFDFQVDGLSMVPPIKPGMLVIQNPNIANPGGGQTGFRLQATNNNGESVLFFGERSFQQSQARFFYKGPFLSGQLLAEGIADTADGGIEWQDLNGEGIYFAKGRFISLEEPYRYSQPIILRAVARTVI